MRGKDRRKELSTPSTSSAESTDTTIETETAEPAASSFSTQQLLCSVTIGDPSPLAPGLINVNEFLLTVVFKLHNQVRSKAKEKKMHFPHLCVVEKFTQDRRRVISLLLSLLRQILKFFRESRAIAQNVNSSTLHPHPNRAASLLSSTIISSSSHTSNITSVNHFLPHTHSTSPSFSSPNRLVATTECFGDGLRVCCSNANSLLGHIETIRLFLASCTYYHIIAITETKLTAEQEDHLVSLGHYVLIRKHRNRQGGGVALFIDKSVTFKFLCASTEEWT